VPTNAERVGGTLYCLARKARSLHRRYKWALSKRHPHESNARQNGSVRAANKTEARKRTTTTSSQLDGTRIRCGCHEYRNAIQVPPNDKGPFGRNAFAIAEFCWFLRYIVIRYICNASWVNKRDQPNTGRGGIPAGHPTTLPAGYLPRSGKGDGRDDLNLSRRKHV
jgi:hypothetical protein